MPMSAPVSGAVEVVDKTSRYRDRSRGLAHFAVDRGKINNQSVQATDWIIQTTGFGE
jgi:hypothetical protein